MPLIPPLLVAMVIATAFWGGVLLARRLRDWGDGRPMLDESSRPPALPAAKEATPDVQKRIRARVAERIHAELATDGLAARAPREGDVRADNLRAGDVITVETGISEQDGDYLVEGFVRMQEGGTTRIVTAMSDAGRRRWLVADLGEQRWLLLEPVVDHDLRDEPPRTIRWNNLAYVLDRRSQATAAASGRHGRPSGTRVGTYTYRGPGDSVMWVERWGRDVLMGVGISIVRHDVAFLPGS